MAKQSGLNQRLYLGGFDISGDVGSINNAGGSRTVQEVTGIDKSGVERIHLKTDGVIDFAGFFNKATDQQHDALKGLPVTDRELMYLITTTRGDPVGMLQAKQMNYDVARNADGSLAVTVNAMGSSTPLEWGVLLVAKIAHSVATNEGSIDNGAADSPTANGAIGHLQHFDWGSGTIEYDIEDSTDDAAFVNLIAFTDQIAAAAFSERVFVAGNVDRYVRAATNGTFTDADFAMGFRRRLAVGVDIVD